MGVVVFSPEINEMKKFLIRIAFLLGLLAIVLIGCKQSMEKDACKLARIQKQKSETVRQMLSCRDSLNKFEFLKKINKLEKQYTQLRITCYNRYSDSSEKAAFEEIFTGYLKGGGDD